MLFVGDGDFDLPLAPGLAKKWDAVSRQLDVRIVGRASAVRSADPRFRLLPQAPRLLRSPAYYAAVPTVVGRELRRFRPDVVITKSPYEAFAVLPALNRARPRPKLVIELHGDWRTASRLYGSPLRGRYARLADTAAAFALRRADGTRAVSRYTASLAEATTGRDPLSVFPTYFDLESFIRNPVRPLPEQPAIVWVGVLQRYKDPGLLAAAWRQIARIVGAARLVIVGDGPLQALVDELVREFPTRVTHLPRLTPSEIAGLLDQSTLLAMSSVSEGLPRVIMEAFARGRPVVATAAGGIPDVVETGRNGVLVEPGDAGALAGALASVLQDRQLAERLSQGALEDSNQLHWTPDRYAEALRELVDAAVLTGSGHARQSGGATTAPRSVR